MSWLRRSRFRHFSSSAIPTSRSSTKMDWSSSISIPRTSGFSTNSSCTRWRAVRHRDNVDDESVAAKSFYFETQALEILAIGIERFALGWSQVESQGKEQPLRRRRTALQRVHELFVENPLVRGMLID